MAVNQYNEGLSVSLPSIECLRMCLFSGGGYRHTSVSKVRVARAIIDGLIEADECGGATDFSMVEFAYDENAFNEAWTVMDNERNERATMASHTDHDAEVRANAEGVSATTYGHSGPVTNLAIVPMGSDPEPNLRMEEFRATVDEIVQSFFEGRKAPVKRLLSQSWRG